MFRRACEIVQPVLFEFNGEQITAEKGDTIAAALLASGILELRRSSEVQSARGPHCMIGNCFECLVEIDGLGSRQACCERAEDGMRVWPHRGKVRPGSRL